MASLSIPLSSFGPLDGSLTSSACRRASRVIGLKNDTAQQNNTVLHMHKTLFEPSGNLWYIQMRWYKRDVARLSNETMETL